MAMSEINCPAVADNLAVQPDALAVATAFLESRIRGDGAAEQLALAWAGSKPADEITLALKAPAVAAAATR